MAPRIDRTVAQTTWMTGLDRHASDQLIARRFAQETEPLTDGDKSFLWEYSGGYPFLLQQLINTKIDARREGVLGDEALVRRALLEQNQVFRNSTVVLAGDGARIVVGEHSTEQNSKSNMQTTANFAPTSTDILTFLFTDIEGSTQLWENHPEAMQVALTRHDAILREAIESGTTL